MTSTATASTIGEAIALLGTTELDQDVTITGIGDEPGSTYELISRANNGSTLTLVGTRTMVTSAFTGTGMDLSIVLRGSDARSVRRLHVLYSRRAHRDAAKLWRGAGPEGLQRARTVEDWTSGAGLQVLMGSRLLAYGPITLLNSGTVPVGVRIEVDAAILLSSNTFRPVVSTGVYSTAAHVIGALQQTDAQVAAIVTGANTGIVDSGARIGVVAP
jgi:hypothetical protein